MKQVKRTIERIGEVIFVKSSRSTNLRVSVRPGHPVRVSAPAHVTDSYVMNFLKEKESWIVSQQQKFSQKMMTFLPETDFKTKMHQLIIVPNVMRRTVEATIAKGEIRVLVPRNLKVEDERVQAFIKKVIVETLRREAKSVIPLLVEDMAKKFNFRYNQVVIKNVHSKWGSCSGSNNLNFNLHLMRLPDELIQYVVLHELVHTVEKNHGPGFWHLLDKVSGDAKRLDRELKKFRVEFIEV
ncbi:MAG: SprT family zinc-dependent metalloprotease [Bacteroidota bacterium]|nr:SprT family zinc-dependent metalloprotease [Bacteroidota bacterium]